jgi:DNA-binding NarL/FixJ family response regulator
MKENKIKVYLIDDHDSVRQSYIRWLENEDIEIVGDENSTNVSIKKIVDKKPDIVLLDIDFPNEHLGGFKIAEELLNKAKAKIIFITHYDEPEIIFEAFKIGASGYFNKRDNLKFLIQIIHNVSEGCLAISPNALSNLIKINYVSNNSLVHKNFALTDQELKVLKFISDGLTNKEIAGKLSLTEKRVKDIISNIMLKMDAKNRAHAVAIAIKNNLINI